MPTPKKKIIYSQMISCQHTPVSYIVLLPYIGRSLLSPTLLSTCILAAIFDNKCWFCARDGVRIAKSSAKSAGIFEQFELKVLRHKHTKFLSRPRNYKIPFQAPQCVTAYKAKRIHSLYLCSQLWLRKRKSLRRWQISGILRRVVSWK
jgi:hypothetical protein